MILACMLVLPVLVPAVVPVLIPAVVPSVPAVSLATVPVRVLACTYAVICGVGEIYLYFHLNCFFVVF